MDDEVALERASQQVIKYLLDEPEFLERWQQKVEEKLESSSSQPSTSSPSIESLRVAVDELTSTIEYVISTFESNVDPRSFYLFSDNSSSSGPNRDASSLFEAGLKVEKLANLMMEELEIEQVSNSIGSACRRISQVLKSYGKRFQGQPSLDIRQILSPANRLCQLFYSISHEISRFSRIAQDQKHVKNLKILSKNVRKWSDEWNIRVVSTVEETQTELERAEKKKKQKKPFEPRVRKNSNSRPDFPHHSPDYGSMHLKRHQRLATSIQEAVHSAEAMRKAENPRRTHPAGSIATSIISKRKGYLIEDSLARARARVPRVVHRPKERETLEVPPLDPESSGEIDEDLMKSARKVTELVMEEMRQKMKIN